MVIQTIFAGGSYLRSIGHGAVYSDGGGMKVLLDETEETRAYGYLLDAKNN